MRKEILKFRKQVQNYLLDNVDKWEFVEVTEHTANYVFEEGVINLWVANGEDSLHFWCSNNFFNGIDVDFELTRQQQKMLWEKTLEDKERSGEKRRIEKTQMRNDLFFKFRGVFGEVRFTGYNDNDWWTKFKPTIVKENDIEWEIDLDKMEATYKPK